MNEIKNRPEDIMPDNVNFVTINGITIRKGSMGSFIANLNIIEQDNKTDAEKKEAWGILTELAPIIRASGLLSHVTWKNKKVEQLLIK